MLNCPIHKNHKISFIGPLLLPNGGTSSHICSSQNYLCKWQMAYKATVKHYPAVLWHFQQVTDVQAYTAIYMRRLCLCLYDLYGLNKYATISWTVWPKGSKQVLCNLLRRLARSVTKLCSHKTPPPPPLKFTNYSLYPCPCILKIATKMCVFHNIDNRQLTPSREKWNPDSHTLKRLWRCE